MVKTSGLSFDFSPTPRVGNDCSRDSDGTLAQRSIAYPAVSVCLDPYRPEMSVGVVPLPGGVCLYRPPHIPHIAHIRDQGGNTSVTRGQHLLEVATHSRSDNTSVRGATHPRGGNISMRKATCISHRARVWGGRPGGEGDRAKWLGHRQRLFSFFAPHTGRRFDVCEY